MAKVVGVILPLSFNSFILSYKYSPIELKAADFNIILSGDNDTLVASSLSSFSVEVTALNFPLAKVFAFIDSITSPTVIKSIVISYEPSGLKFHVKLDTLPKNPS